MFGKLEFPVGDVKPFGPFQITLVILVPVVTPNVAVWVEQMVLVAAAVNEHNMPQLVAPAPGALELF